ncbi:MAG: 5-formyltetrahydrofolate cyclo-ligase [Flavobacteriaceae bacterium]|nr:5-formyltetrahydrofolate cyclo-ligase [Flavobacteriaceae bacterium]
MKKAELRKKYKALRSNLTTNDIESLSIEIANELLQVPIWHHTFYHIFLTIEEHHEINTEYILNILAGMDKNIVVSKSNFENNTLENFLLTDNTLLKKSIYNIPEPVDGIPIENNKIDIVFVPLLAFDKHGNRIGYGKGFYDNFLKTCNEDALKIGLSFFEAEELINDTRDDDIKLDYCVTPTRLYQF